MCETQIEGGAKLTVPICPICNGEIVDINSGKCWIRGDLYDSNTRIKYISREMANGRALCVEMVAICPICKKRIRYGIDPVNRCREIGELFGPDRVIYLNKHIATTEECIENIRGNDNRDFAPNAFNDDAV